MQQRKIEVVLPEEQKEAHRSCCCNQEWLHQEKSEAGKVGQVETWLCLL
jgi:hypothetical protein